MNRKQRETLMLVADVSIRIEDALAAIEGVLLGMTSLPPQLQDSSNLRVRLGDVQFWAQPLTEALLASRSLLELNALEIIPAMTRTSQRSPGGLPNSTPEQLRLPGL